MTEKKQGTDREQLEQAIIALDNQRAILGDAAVDAALGSMREKLSALIETQEATQQRKLATVLFMDIVGSTSITQDMDPEDAMTIMDTALQRLANPVYAHGGRVTRFMGDGFLALFGTPVARENEPEEGVRAGLQILAEAQIYAQEMEALWQIPDFNVRVGISTGLVIIGGDSEAENTIMGTTVNLAARLESAAKPGTLLISHHTYQHIHDMFDVQILEPIAAKGFSAPVQIYRVQRAKPPAFHMSTWRVAGIETRMIGRDPELLMLLNMYHDATEDAEVHVVTILGDAGVGKSRLLYEFEKWIEMLPDEVLYFKGRATPEAGTMPYGLIRRMLVHRFKILESDSAAEVLEKFRAGMAPVLNIGQADLVGQFLGLDFSTSQAVQAQLGSELFGESATAHLVKYLQATASKPTALLLEDIHWADDSSLDLLDYLVSTIPDTRLLVVCLARPTLFERRPNWGEGQEFHTQINLKPLSRRASRALVGEILKKMEDVPTDLRDMIVEGAEGNPFYVEELIKMLIEDGVIVSGEERWRVELERLAEVRVPSTLTGILQARLDSLSQGEKTVLQRASVVGRLFWDAVVAELASDKVEAAQVDKLLEDMRNRELIFRHEYSVFEATDEYIFKHALLRDVTYETVLLKLRLVYHAQVAQWLERTAKERINEYLSLIARHYELAGEGEKAVAYLLRAGDQARLAYACQEASDYYRRALPLLEEQGEQDQMARTLMKLGLTYHTAFDFKRSRQAYEEGFALWKRGGEIREGTTLPPAPHALRLIWEDDPPTLDPTMASDSFSIPIIEQLYSGLVELNAEMDAMPDIARSWEMLEGGRKFIFYLRDDVRWSDGAPVTAGDFEYAWKRVLDPVTESPNAGLFYDIKNAQAFHRGECERDDVGIRVPDDYTLVIELEGPTGYFLHLLTRSVCFPVPRHILEAHGKGSEAAEVWTKEGITNGPFKLKTWLPGQSIVLSRNQEYHGRFTGNLEQVELSLQRVKPSTGLKMYEADDLDILSIPALEMDRVRQLYAGEYIAFPILITEYLGFDLSRPPFDDARVRQAFALAIDKEALANVTLRGYVSPATGGFVPSGMPGHSERIGLPHNLERARQLLAEAGFPDGRGFPVIDSFTHSFIQHSFIQPSMEYLQAQWRDVLGVSITWQTMDWAAYLGRLRKEPPHIFLVRWGADYPDPDNFLRVGFWRVKAKWQNESYIELVEEARRVTDLEERMKLYRQADSILIGEAVIAPLYYGRWHMLAKPWVSNYFVSATRDIYWKNVIIKPH